MRIAITTVQVPFVRGGAESHAQGLLSACRNAGHSVDIVDMPFRFGPESEVRRAMEIWAEEDFSHLNGYTPDRVICLKFPSYYVKHPNKYLWLLHQHRAVYDLWQENAGISASLKTHIQKHDTSFLSKIEHRYTNSQNVTNRLRKYNNLESRPLYHPPPMAEAYESRPPMPYIFCPSRLEKLKRQDLLIEAMRHVRSPIRVLIAGDGGQMQYYSQLIEQYDLTGSVRLLGEVDQGTLLALYANCLGVFFGPLDEDYGYVTLEAMLSAKPVITCTDSGGPLEFVDADQTGWVVEPNPKRIAEVIETLSETISRSQEMGRAGLEKYHKMEISWDRVVETLLK